jgi:Uroporphyrinogen decarboxylase (URO-D)
MNARERFLRTARFQPVDRAFLLQPWVWPATLERWRAEGLAGDAGLTATFGTDAEACAPIAFQGPYGPHLNPPLERKVLWESDRHIVVRDEDGATVRLFRDDPGRSMPEWIQYPMKGREDWESLIRPRLDPAIPGRCPAGEELQRYAGSVRDRDYPLGLWSGSFYGWPRSFMGVEQLSYTFYDDPGLIHEMCEHIADFVIEVTHPLLDAIDCDFAFIWEDMAGKGGPLCSPRTYQQFMLPPLKRVTGHLRAHGIDIIIVDSDGNNDALIPLWLEAGVNGLRPFEIAAGCDPVATRRQYGRDLIIQGAIDKRALARGPAEIDREVLSKVPWLCLQGGYFPQIDHLVPPDVPLESYRYYSDLVCQVVADPERWLAEAQRRGLGAT